MIDPYDFDGGVYSMPSQQGGRVFIQGLDNFARHSRVKELVNESIAGM